MIVVVGEALVDLVIRPDGAVTAALGGAPFNTARTVGRLGADVAFAGALGTDRFGDLLAAALSDAGVAIAAAPRVAAPTTLAAAEVDDGGAASYRFYLDGTSAPALTGWTAPEVADLVFTGGLGLVLEPMASVVAESVVDLHPAVGVVVDVNCRPRVIPDRETYVERVHRIVGRADVVKVSDDDLAYLDPARAPLDAASALLALGPRVVLLTRGGDGVTVLLRDGQLIVVEVPPVEVVDTIGAGDAFGGGFLAWWQLGGHHLDDLARPDVVERAVRAATAVAAVVCARRGADPPWRSELPADWSG